MNLANDSHLFQSMLFPVHYCPTCRKWTLEPTLKKKNQDCLMVLYPVKKQATRHSRLQPVFL